MIEASPKGTVRFCFISFFFIVDFLLTVFLLSDLSFQTAARILAAPAVEALTVMRDLSQNFPTKARYTEGNVATLLGPVLTTP